MANKSLIFLITGSQLKGLGQTLKMLDSDNVGTDDLAGNLATVAGGVLVASGTGDLHSIRQGLMLNIQLSQEWLDNNPESTPTPAAKAG